MAKLLGPLGFPVRSFLEVPARQARFLSMLRDAGLRLHPKSALALSFHDLDTYLSFQKGETTLTAVADMARVLRNGQSMLRMLNLLEEPSGALFELLRPRLSVFSGADIAFMRSGANTQSRNYVWELLCAAAVFRFCEDVSFSEPDILCSFGGSRWGLSCKVLYSAKPRNQIDAIAKGASQLEHSMADFGLVVVNATDLIDHSDYIETSRPDQHRVWGHPREVGASLNTKLRGVAGKLEAGGLNDRLRTNQATQEIRSKTRSVVFFASTVAWAGGAPCDVDQCLVYLFRHFQGPESVFATALARALSA